MANSKSKYMGEIVAKSRFVSDVNESNVIEVRVAATGVKRGLFPACDERESKFRTSESSKGTRQLQKKRRRKKRRDEKCGSKKEPEKLR